MADLFQIVNRILSGFRSELVDFEHTVELLEGAYSQQPAEQQERFFELLRGQLYAEPYSHLESRRTAHAVIIRSWARFGPVDQLPTTVFSLLNSTDTGAMEAWARAIAPEFAHSLYSYRGRFSQFAIDSVKTQCVLFTGPAAQNLVGLRYPESLIQVAQRLERIAEKIEFDRFVEKERLAAPSPRAAHEGAVAHLSLLDLKFEILRLIVQSGQRAVNKYNLLGRPTTKGELELALGRALADAERNLAYKAFDELKKAGHIQPTYTDLVQPENWVVATEAGQRGLATGVLDDLDDALAKIAPHLPKLRRGAWASLDSGEPHCLEQAAHSARELIDQTLKAGASDEEVKRHSSFRADQSSVSGVTRRMRLKHLMEKFAGELSETDLRVAEKACDFVLAIDDKLIALAHSRTEPKYDEVEAAVVSAEIALRSILSSFRGGQLDARAASP